MTRLISSTPELKTILKVWYKLLIWVSFLLTVSYVNLINVGKANQLIVGRATSKKNNLIQNKSNSNYVEVSSNVVCY